MAHLRKVKTMTRKLIATVLLTAGFVLACSDSAAPPLDGANMPQQRVFRPLSWKSMDAPLRFSVVGDVAGGDWQLDGEVFASASAPPLDDYAVSFWAVKGETRGVLINWLEPSGDTTIAHPYLTFMVPPGGLDEAPNGRDYESGDSVVITITIDTSSMIAQFGPSGLEFDDHEPAELQYWYTGSGGDLNDDGVVDQTDADIEANLLDLWQSPGSSGTWATVWSEHSLSEDWFRAGVEHFSGFAIAY